MKILQVVPYFYPAWTYGGSVRGAYALSKQPEGQSSTGLPVGECVIA